MFEFFHTPQMLAQHAGDLSCTISSCDIVVKEAKFKKVLFLEENSYGLYSSSLSSSLFTFKVEIWLCTTYYI
jgi:hypothetical protein